MNEAQLHQKFSHLHIHGEWYQLTTEMVAFIERCCRPFLGVSSEAELFPGSCGGPMLHQYSCYVDGERHDGDSASIDIKGVACVEVQISDDALWINVTEGLNTCVARLKEIRGPITVIDCRMANGRRKPTRRLKAA